MLHNYSFESLDRSAKIPKRPRLSDSGCTKSVFAKNELDKYKFKFRPNLKNERLKAAGDHELRVCGIVDALFTYNGRTKLMKGLVTPDLTSEIIVSCKDAENIGALTLNRADSQVLKCTNSRKRSSPSPVQSQKRTKLDVQSNVNNSLAGAPNATQAQPKINNVDNQSKIIALQVPAGLPNAAQDKPAQQSSVNIEQNNTAMQESPAESPNQETPAAQGITPEGRHPQVPPPSGQSKPDFNEYELILCPKSKTKIVKIIADWYKKYPCLSDTLSPKPMVGPPMRINLKSEVAGQKYPKKAMTAVLIPLHYKEASNALIDELLRSKVIRRVKESAVPKFQSRVFVVEKPGTPVLAVRLVNDFSEANKWVERPAHPFAAGNDLLKAIPRSAQFFCKLDALWGYFQIELDEDSREITTFIHELGIFEYLRAPMGLNASGDEFC